MAKPRKARNSKPARARGQAPRTPPGGPSHEPEVVDPLAPDAKQILGTVMMMYQQGYPLRYGVVLTSTDELSRVRRGLAPTPPSADATRTSHTLSPRRSAGT